MAAQDTHRLGSRTDDAIDDLRDGMLDRPRVTLWPTLVNPQTSLARSTHGSPDGFMLVASSRRAPWLTPKYRRAWTSRSIVSFPLAIAIGEHVKTAQRTKSWPWRTAIPSWRTK
jgi:hypothetical protein